MLRINYLNFKNLSQLLSLALGLFQLLLLQELLLGLVLFHDQSLELAGKLPCEVQGLEDLLVLRDCQLLVIVQLLSALMISSVSVKFSLKRIENKLHYKWKAKTTSENCLV